MKFPMKLTKFQGVNLLSGTGNRFLCICGRLFSYHVALLDIQLYTYKVPCSLNTYNTLRTNDFYPEPHGSLEGSRFPNI